MAGIRWAVLGAGAAAGVVLTGAALFAFAGTDDDTAPVPGVEIGTLSAQTDDSRTPGALPGQTSRTPQPQQRTTTQTAAPGSGPVAGPQQIARAAEAAVGPGARAVEVDSDDDGAKAWEVDVIGADGAKREVDLDRSGAVLQVRRDD